MGEKVKKKSGCLKWFLIIFGVIVLIGACTAALGGDDSDTEDEKVETTAPIVEEVEETPEEKTTREAKEAEKKAESEQKAKEEAEVEAKAEEERIAQEEAEAEAKAKEESVPREHKSALKKAESYAETMHMSKVGIYDQLTSEYGENFPQKLLNMRWITLYSIGKKTH